MAGTVPPTLKILLTSYGLQGLVGWATQQIINGNSEEEIMLQLKVHPIFHQRFPAIVWRQNDGLPPLSVDQYLEYEQTAHQFASMYGFPITQDDINHLLSNDVSPKELEERFTITAAAVYSSTPEERAAFSELWGVSSGQLMRYWMDPKKELPKLQQQYRAGQIAGAAMRSGYGRITRDQAERLESIGMEENQALTAFASLDDMLELFSPLDEFESKIDQDAQVEMIAGNADVAQQVEKRASKRVAEFGGTGEFSAGEEGFATGSAD